MSAQNLQDELKQLMAQYDGRSRRQHILACLSDAVSNILYYDRRNDEDLGLFDIPDALEAGEISIEEMVQAFELELREGLEEEEV